MSKKTEQKEEKWENDFRKQFDELGLKPPKNSMPGIERELIIDYFRTLISTIREGEKRKYEKAIRYSWSQASEDTWGIACHYKTTFLSSFRKKLRELNK